MPENDDGPFKKGDAVEVMVESGHKGSKVVTWHSATVLKSTQGTKGKVFVEFINLTSYENTHLRERVDFRRVRPIPPPARWWFKVGDKVEIFYDYGWRKGSVLEIVEGSKYSVKVDGLAGASEVDRWRVRMFREWVDGVWVSDESSEQETLSATTVTPLEKLEAAPMKSSVKSSKKLEIMPTKTVVNSTEKLETLPRKIAVKFDGKERTLTKKFDVGTRVEVSSDEEGYEGAYYAAIVVGYSGNCRYLVEYLTLRTSDEKEALREEAESWHVRPCPSYMARIDRYKLFEIVDCWYNDGWWKGEVSKVLPSHKYVVYFSSSVENLVFTHADLRPHQEWIDGRWLMVSTSKEQTKGAHPKLLDENRRPDDQR